MNSLRGNNVTGVDGSLSCMILLTLVPWLYIDECSMCYVLLCELECFTHQVSRLYISLLSIYSHTVCTFSTESSNLLFITINIHFLQFSYPELKITRENISLSLAEIYLPAAEASCWQSSKSTSQARGTASAKSSSESNGAALQRISIGAMYGFTAWKKTQTFWSQYIYFDSLLRISSGLHQQSAIHLALLQS